MGTPGISAMCSNFGVSCDGIGHGSESERTRRSLSVPASLASPSQSVSVIPDGYSIEKTASCCSPLGPGCWSCQRVPSGGPTRAAISALASAGGSACHGESLASIFCQAAAPPRR